ncbi:MAG: CRISPR-associated protein Cas4 [Ignavibacteriae bacterium]|nr:CRISPR-associated protein Cas4 [Ignavibacteriota bacterium]
MYIEDDFIQLSALQHYVFCPRQCALIHVEGLWCENVFTVRGDILHEKVDTDSFESRGALRTVRGLRIHSTRLGIAGRCDVVEFRRASESTSGDVVLPVEFKSGQPKDDISDKVQLCAQALCLEEMLNTKVERGDFFYGRTRRRVHVEINEQLRTQTEEIISAVHDIVSRKYVPKMRYTVKCRNCSLYDVCQPKAMNERKLQQYMNTLYTP